MNLIENFKLSIVAKSIDNMKKKTPFDEVYSELFQLPLDAGHDMNNSYYFSGHDQAGSSIFFRLGKRGGGANELWFALKDASGDIYFNKQQIFYNGNNANVNGGTKSDADASVTCIETGKKWAFNFRGKILKAILDENRAAIGSGQEVDADFKGIFSATSSIFDFSRHMDTTPIARALAREKWSKSFIMHLKENHQTHYEQPGDLTGTLILNKKPKSIKMQAIRDHSFGKRDWDYMDRHIWIMALMETGETLNVNMVRYPAVNELQTGYFISKGNISAPVCVEYATSMDELECIGRVPEKFQLIARLSDGRTFHISCKKELEYIFPFDNGDYTIHEGIGSFSFNESKGRGIIEFGFNKDQARWTRKTREARQHADT